MKIRIWFQLALILPVLLGGCAFVERKEGLPKGTSVIVVIDPYEGIDWKSFSQHKANFHTHTTESDGDLSPARVIDKYLTSGYTILALTDHNVCAYPWEKFGREPSSLGMVAVPGNEHSTPIHIVSLFCAYEPDKNDNLDHVLNGISESKGLAVLCHPGEYWMPDLVSYSVPEDVLKKFADIFAKHNPYLLGMEVFNAGYRWRFDPMLWDALLAEMMPGRPVWGFAAEDIHFARQIGRDWNVFVVPALTAEDVRESMEKGRFYFSTLGAHAQKDRDVAATPVIRSIVHNRNEGTITIDATEKGKPLEDSKCRWISKGRVVHNGLSINYRKIKTISKYLRAELTGTGGITFTNPFGLLP
ncbi:MAG TPA: hypothetical protein PKN36_02270 [bacterium]|nr:hypothetical protein [bacterium]